MTPSAAAPERLGQSAILGRFQQQAVPRPAFICRAPAAPCKISGKSMEAPPVFGFQVAVASRIIMGTSSQRRGVTEYTLPEPLGSSRTTGRSPDQPTLSI